ncbi:uncharacterized protein LOC34618559 [Cyclospora cayetanensis]|uniref:Uncharacterized protein LOC34618559 n=1 Tax=Cyclospora cayetanensis TaxID=88456 RepID=A0A6P6RT91_9EIME|nr:uncharacterized protein LOC34618559 [Cyclospora cayetanensis]
MNGSTQEVQTAAVNSRSLRKPPLTSSVGTSRIIPSFPFGLGSATQQPISLRRETPSPVASYSWTLRRRPHSKRPSGTPPSWGTVKSNSAGNPSAASWTPSQSFSRTLAGGDLSAASRLLSKLSQEPPRGGPSIELLPSTLRGSISATPSAAEAARRYVAAAVASDGSVAAAATKAGEIVVFFLPEKRACCPLLPATWAQHGVFGAPRRSSRHRQACSGTRALREASRCSSADYSSFEGTLSRRTPESFLTNGHVRVQRPQTPFQTDLHVSKVGALNRTDKPRRLKRLLLLQAGGVLTVWREQQPQKQDIDRSARASGGASAQKQTQRHQHRPYKRECCLDAAAASVLHSGTAAAPSCYSFSQYGFHI